MLTFRRRFGICLKEGHSSLDEWLVRRVIQLALTFQKWSRCLVHHLWNSLNAEIGVLNSLITTVSVLEIEIYMETKLGLTMVLYLGHLLDTVPPAPPTTLEHLEENLEGRNKELFLDFMKSMLQWVPENRKTASELLEDPWLNKKFE